MKNNKLSLILYLIAVLLIFIPISIGVQASFSGKYTLSSRLFGLIPANLY